MSALGPVGTYLYQQLGPLVDGQMYTEMIDGDAKWPAIRVSLQSAPRVIGNGGVVAVSKPLILVSVHGRQDVISIAGLRAIAGQFEDILPTSEPIPIGDYLLECWQDPRGDFQDSELDGDARFDCAGEFYRFFIQKA